MAMRVPGFPDIVGLTAEQQLDDMRQAVSELATAWEAWRHDLRFNSADDVPPPPWKRAPTRGRKPRPSKGELIAHLIKTVEHPDITLDAISAAIQPLLGKVWSDWPDAAGRVHEAVEQLRWLWSRHGLWQREQPREDGAPVLGFIAERLNRLPRPDRWTH